MTGFSSGDETPNHVGGTAARSTSRRRLDASTARAWARIVGTTAAAAGIALVAVAAESAHPGSVLASKSQEKGTVWVNNGPATLDPGNEPHLACNDIWILGDAMSASSGTFVIHGWPGTGTGEQVYPATTGTTAAWSYDQGAGGVQEIADVSGATLVANAISDGDTANAQQGYHFKLDLTDGADDAKSKVFWIDCDPGSSSSSSSSSQSSSQTSSGSSSQSSSQTSSGSSSQSSSQTTSSGSSQTSSSSSTSSQSSSQTSSSTSSQSSTTSSNAVTTTSSGSSPTSTSSSSSSSISSPTTSSSSSSTTVTVTGAIHATSTSTTQSSQGDPHSGGVNGLFDGASPESGGVDGLVPVPTTGAGGSGLTLLLGACLVVAGVSALGCGIRVRRDPVTAETARG